MALIALPVMKYGSIFSIDSADSRWEYSLAATPTKTPVRLPRSDAGEYPARSRPSQTVSSISRCCGSIQTASRGEIPKNSGIESVDAVEVSAVAGVDLARCVWVRVVELVDVEAVLRDLPDGVDTAGQQLPERFRVGGAGEAAGHGDDRDRLVRARRHRRRRLGPGLADACSLSPSTSLSR